MNTTFARVNRNVTTAPATLEELRQLYAVCIFERKESWQRTQFGGGGRYSVHN